MTKIKPWRSIFRYDKENYQSVFTGADTFAYYYNGRLNKCLFETNSSKVYECEDYSLPTDSASNYRIYDTDEKILGYRCRIIEFQSRRFLNRYYVSKILFIAPGTYQKHLAYNWQLTHEKTRGALILKSEHRFKNYTMTGTATAINRQDKDFRAFAFDDAFFRSVCDTKK